MTREKLLRILKVNQGEWISGADLGRKLNVSRSAINKHMKKLRTAGYSIAAYPKKGYCLDKEPDLLLSNEIREGLRTRVLGQGRVICHDIIDSTNAAARQEADSLAPEGTLVVADAQTRGRGRRGRDWSSPPGTGIYMSLVLRPAIDPEKAMKITLMTAVAATEAVIAETGLPVRIKWPNDLQVGGKKIAGILTEISTEMDMVNFLMVGMGINVNTRPKHFDPELTKTATSLFIEAGREFSRVRLIQAFLMEMEKYYGIFQERGFEEILDAWKRRSDTLGKRVNVVLIDKTCSGLARDVAEDGRLIVEDDKGKIHRFFSGDVSIR